MRPFCEVSGTDIACAPAFTMLLAFAYYGSTVVVIVNVTAFALLAALMGLR